MVDYKEIERSLIDGANTEEIIEDIILQHASEFELRRYKEDAHTLDIVCDLNGLDGINKTKLIATYVHELITCSARGAVRSQSILNKN